MLRFSIVVPNYNSGATLERTILSLLAQDYPNLQLIMADGGSKDDSVQIIEKYRDRFDKVIQQKDNGQADGINRAFKLADGDIHGWLCSDDELTPGALHHVNELFEKNPDVGVITGACQRLFSDGVTYVVPAEKNPWEKINIQNVIEQPSTFWRGSLHRKVGELVYTYYLAFDWELWIRFKRSGAKILSTEQVLSKYYFSETNKSGNSGRVFEQEAFRMLRQYGPLFGGLAYIFRFLYFHFDLKGCYDKPPTCGLLRSHLFIWTLAFLRLTIGKKRLYLYNWHFASCQERGLKWW